MQIFEVRSTKSHKLNFIGSSNFFFDILLELLFSQVKLGLKTRNSNLSVNLSLGGITNLTKLDIWCNPAYWVLDDINLLNKTIPSSPKQLQEWIVYGMALDFSKNILRKISCIRVINWIWALRSLWEWIEIELSKISLFYHFNFASAENSVPPSSQNRNDCPLRNGSSSLTCSIKYFFAYKVIKLFFFCVLSYFFFI